MKAWQSWTEQVELLRSRGLEIDDGVACVAALKRVNYYRFSGYARHFQIDPASGDNRFEPGTRFDDILALHDLDATLRQVLMASLTEVELVLRTGFAYAVAGDDSPCGGFPSDEFYASGGQGDSVVTGIRRDLDRSKDHYIAHFRDDSAADPYARLPVWAAVEALSFGTISKCIERARAVDVVDLLNAEYGLAKQGLAYRIRALVYVRNRCAHHSRLWNHHVVDAGPTPSNVRHRAKKRFGQFHPQSVMDVIVSLDDIATRALGQTALLETIGELVHSNDSYWKGLVYPK